MRMNHLHSVLCLERQAAGQHLVKHDAHGVEIGAVVNDPVHAAGLFRRDVLQVAFKSFRVAEIWRFQVKLGGNPKVDDPGSSLVQVDEYVAGTDIFVNNVVAVDVAEHPGNRDGEMNKIEDIVLLAAKSFQ